MKENNSSIHIRYSFSNFKFVSEVSGDKYIGLSYNRTSKATTCKKCHKPINRYKGTRYATVEYGTVHKKTTLIQFKKRLYYCYDCNCSTIESTPETTKCTQHSDTFKSLILEELKQNVSTYTSVAKSLNTSISSIIRIFDQVNSPSINKYEITTINIDETRFIKSVGTYQLVVIDSASGDVNDITADKKQETVESLLETYYPNVELVNQDLWNPYRNAAMKVYGEQVKIVADLFHVVRQGTWAFNRERRSYMKSTNFKIIFSY